MRNFIDGLFAMPLYDADKGDGGGGAEPEETPTEEPSKTFTQAELDEIVAKRLERERKKYADYSDLQTKLSEYEQAEEERKKAAMSEQERIEAEKAEALRKAEEAESKSAEALRKANERLIRAEFRLLAKEVGIRSDAIDDAYKLADFSEVEVSEDGAVSGVDVVVNSLKESKPYLADQEKPKPKEIGNPSGGGGADDDEVRTLESELEAAKKAKNISKVIEISNKLKTKRGK